MVKGKEKRKPYHSFVVAPLFRDGPGFVEDWLFHNSLKLAMKEKKTLDFVNDRYILMEIKEIE